MSKKIIEIGLLNDEVFSRRFKQVRRVFSPNGIAPTVPAACGEGGGDYSKDNRERWTR